MWHQGCNGDKSVDIVVDKKCSFFVFFIIFLRHSKSEQREVGTYHGPVLAHHPLCSARLYTYSIYSSGAKVPDATSGHGEPTEWEFVKLRTPRRVFNLRCRSILVSPCKEMRKEKMWRTDQKKTPVCRRHNPTTLICVHSWFDKRQLSVFSSSFFVFLKKYWLKNADLCLRYDCTMRFG